MRIINSKFICVSGIIASVYVLLTLISPSELRLSECLCILPAFSAAAIPGVSIGCFLANIITGCSIIDIIGGSIATLLGAFGTCLLKKNRWLAPLPPVITNTIIVPFIMKYSYPIDKTMPILFLTIAVSELITAYGMGQILYSVFKKHPNMLS